MTSDWDYFAADRAYAKELNDRLANGIEMDSAKALGRYVDETCTGDLRIADIGGGPGHYYPVMCKLYTKGHLRYTSIDIDADCIRFGAEHYRENSNVALVRGSALEPNDVVPADTNCLISANTLPHIPTIAPLLALAAERTEIRYLVFRMLVGQECVQIRKHLREHDFEDIFERQFQFNNIYSLPYLATLLGTSWTLDVRDDVFDSLRLAQHRVAAQESDAFYGNRVSRLDGGRQFKGDIYMPWKFVVGVRV